MRALIQRVKSASVNINGTVHSSIERGILVFLGVKNGDSEDDAAYLATRCANLRIFEDVQGKMNVSVREAGGNALVISQFTLYADTRSGNRPSFTDAAPPGVAERLYEYFVQRLRSELTPARVSVGVFRAMMDIALVNDGPVTILLESKPSIQQNA